MRIGYPAFFVYTSTLGLPALVLLFFLARKMRQEAPVSRRWPTRST